jgi:hypothetical protein
MTGELEPWQRPPFEANNRAALTHGAFSAREVEPGARELLLELEREIPEWVERVDTQAVLAWARSESRAQLLRTYLDQHGLLDSKGRPRPAADLLLRVEAQAARLRSRLGFDPASRAKLRQSTAAARLDLARLMSDEDDDADES